MRKMLLMGAALLGGTVALAPAVPAFAAGPVASAYGGPGEMPVFLGGNNIFNSQGGPLPNNPLSPTPGTVTIHLNGRVVWLGALEGDSDNNYNPGGLGPYKHSIYQQGGYFRLYPGVDGLASNGLRYGATVEIRQNMGGVAIGGGGDTLYVRRAAVYAGTNELGIIRLGQDDGPFSQMDGGVTTNQYGDGLANGDGPGVFPSNLNVPFPFWSGVGAEYTIDKIVYFSPQIAGFDLGVSFAPSANSFNTFYSCTGAATTNCNNLSAAPGFAGRFDNMVEIMGRYRATFNGVGVYAIAGYAVSGVVNNSSGPTAYDGFSVGDAGLALDFAGFRVAGNVLFGDYNGQVGLKPKKGVHSVSWTGGASYTTGPITLGVSYTNQQDQGAASGTALVGVSQETNSVIGAIAQYAVAPGMAVQAIYLYDWRHQGDWDYLAAAKGTSHNSVNMQAFIVRTQISW